MTTQRFGRLEVTIEDARLVLVGRIDDGALALGDVSTQVTATEITIDTHGVTFMNSVGMREWMRFVRTRIEAGGSVTLERVADVLMTQMNLMPEYFQGIRIVSFHAQYACPACGAESAPVVDAIANLALLQQMKAPQMPCPECKAAMDLADFPERYLSLFRS